MRKELTLWQQIALQCVSDVAKVKSLFTGDDVMDLLDVRGSVTNEARALGPVMVMASKSGVMEKTESFKSSARRTQHGSPRRVWLSLVYEGEL
jgi:hypothetical protein